MVDKKGKKVPDSPVQPGLVGLCKEALYQLSQSVWIQASDV